MFVNLLNGYKSIQREYLWNGCHVIITRLCLLFQGALAVEVNLDDKQTIELVSKLIDNHTSLCCAAERNFLRTLVRGNWEKSKFKQQLSRTSSYLCEIVDLQFYA